MHADRAPCRRTDDAVGVQAVTFLQATNRRLGFGTERPVHGQVERCLEATHRVAGGGRFAFARARGFGSAGAAHAARDCSRFLSSGGGSRGGGGSGGSRARRPGRGQRGVGQWAGDRRRAAAQRGVGQCAGDSVHRQAAARLKGSHRAFGFGTEDAVDPDVSERALQQFDLAAFVFSREFERVFDGGRRFRAWRGRSDGLPVCEARGRTHRERSQRSERRALGTRASRDELQLGGAPAGTGAPE